ncbi:MAG: bifunctional phosphoribosylaminoimidazolecarboxamide formyltransferase/IMP cyclohydrolase, partial [bacterium]
MATSPDAVNVRRALLSVSDKSGIVDFARGLDALGIEILSTGGTRRVLEDEGIPVVDVAEYSGSGEMMEGRVKTLHPKIHAGLLARRGHEGDEQEMAEAGWGTIDLVAVNLYPFEEKAVEGGLDAEEAASFIDIGGPTMLRSAAKNPRGVVVVPDPMYYAEVLSALEEGGAIPLTLSRSMAAQVFVRTSRYDAVIASYLQALGDEKDTGFPAVLSPTLERVDVLRYGENPHQRAAFYRDPVRRGPNLADADQLGGKELSFNNIIDLESALGIPLDFVEPACAMIKHTNPCGVATGEDLIAAYDAALATDPISAFGGLAGFNRTVTEELAEKMAERFWEAVIAPDYDEEALEILRTRKNLRIMRYRGGTQRSLEGSADYKRVYGGLLVQ